MDCKLRAKNCGGCPLLGLDYAAQLKQKEEKVRALLGKYGPVHPIRGMEQPYHYRNKVISTFAPGWGGKLTSGIYAANSHKVLPVESCLLQDEVLDKTMQAVRAAANACRYQPYDEDKGTGLVRHCLLRRGVATGQVMVVLVTAQPVLPGAKNFVKALLAEAAQRGVTVTTVVQNVNSRKTSVVLGEAEKVLYGKGFILDTLCGKTYAISPRSFYQVNPAQTAVLYGLAVEAAKLTGKEVVLDAYFAVPKEQRQKGLRVGVSASSFVPKPFTPFQWCRQDDPETVRRKQRLVREHFVPLKSAHFNYHDSGVSQIEACFALGDRRLARVLHRAWQLGCRLDGWTDQFRYDLWLQAFEDCGLDIAFYAHRERALDELLPWDHIDAGIDKAFLKREYERAMRAQTTRDCREGCNGCGLQKLKGVCRACE